jgi:hypothetical protein
MACAAFEKLLHPVWLHESLLDRPLHRQFANATTFQLLSKAVFDVF